MWQLHAIDQREFLSGKLNPTRIKKSPTSFSFSSRVSGAPSKAHNDQSVKILSMPGLTNSKDAINAQQTVTDAVKPLSATSQAATQGEGVEPRKL